MWARFLSDYGMLLVLLAVCAYFSAATYAEQHPTGASGGAALGVAIVRQTDPGANILANQWDLTFGGVYRIPADLGTMSLLLDHFVQPNGLAFSPDESVLYVVDSRRRQIRAFDMMPNGTLACVWMPAGEAQRIRFTSNVA